MNKQKRKTTLLTISVVIFMFGMSFAAVPLYDLFCRVTGFGGTTQISQVAPETFGERELKIFFNADTANDLPWEFNTEQRKVESVTGKRNLVFFTAKNTSSETTVGMAAYNVVPDKAGKYFSKIKCFCFERQELKAGEAINFPVSFFIDPAIEDDPYLKDVKSITLSYSFFKYQDGKKKPL